MNTQSERGTFLIYAPRSKTSCSACISSSTSVCTGNNQCWSSSTHPSLKTPIIHHSQWWLLRLEAVSYTCSWEGKGLHSSRAEEKLSDCQLHLCTQRPVGHPTLSLKDATAASPAVLCNQWPLFISNTAQCLAGSVSLTGQHIFSLVKVFVLFYPYHKVD